MGGEDTPAAAVKDRDLRISVRQELVENPIHRRTYGMIADTKQNYTS